MEAKTLLSAKVLPILMGNALGRPSDLMDCSLQMANPVNDLALRWGWGRNPLVSIFSSGERTAPILNERTQLPPSLAQMYLAMMMHRCTDVPSDDDAEEFLNDWDDWSEHELCHGPKARREEHFYDFNLGKIVTLASVAATTTSSCNPSGKPEIDHIVKAIPCMPRFIPIRAIGTSSTSMNG